MHTAIHSDIHEGRSPATRIALLSNIHANLQALEAVVADARQRGATRFVCLGGVVGNGPNPIETLRWVKENCDWLLVALFEDGFLGRFNLDHWSAGAAGWAHSVVWAQQEFQKHPETADLVAWLAQCPKAVLAPPFWFILGPPGSDGIGWHIINPNSARVAPEDARKWFSAFPPRVTTCLAGAMHRGGIVWPDGRAAPEPTLASPTKLSDPLLVGLDNVGLTSPYDLRASYAMLDADQITFHRVPYDMDAFAAAAARTSLLPGIAKSRFRFRRNPRWWNFD